MTRMLVGASVNELDEYVACQIIYEVDKFLRYADQDESVTTLSIAASQALQLAAYHYHAAPNLSLARAEFLSAVAAYGPLSGLIR